MAIEPSKRVQNLGTYAFAELDAIVARLRASGADPIDFGVGDPTVPTPSIIRAACARAIDEHRSSGYPSYRGSDTFRTAAAQWMERRFGLSIDRSTEITATIGSKEAVFNVHEGFVDRGDVVISPTPGYPPYARGATFAEGRNYFYPLRESNDFLPDLDSIPTDIARQAKIFWICQPFVPTGKVIPGRRLDGIAAFCREYDILLCSDEAYSEIWFDRRPHSVLEHTRRNVLAFFSLSKRSAMTGYRCGWVAGDRDAIEVFRKVKTNIDSGTPTFIQDAAVVGLRDEAHVDTLRAEYGEKREILVRALTKAGFPECLPEAGLFVWQKTPEGLSDLEVARQLLKPDMALIVSPGSWLAEPAGSAERGSSSAHDADRYIRLALVPPMDRILEASERLSRLCLRAAGP